MRQLWIGGRPAASRAGGVREIQDPASLESIDEVFESTADDVRGAVASAVEGHAQWRRVPAVERARLLHETAIALRADRAMLSELLTREGGKPRIENLDEVEWCA